MERLMTVSQTFRTRWQITFLVAVAELAHLGWEFLHGGVHSHHLLNRADLPAISNAWGAIFLPALAWFLSGQFLKRVAASGSAKSVVTACLGSFFLGIALSATFIYGYEDASSYIFLGIILAGLVLPVYRGEYVLGFVLGMTFTFGAMLPTLAAIFVATISAVVRYLVHPVFGWAVARARA
jgi:hypothetical protein